MSNGMGFGADDAQDGSYGGDFGGSEGGAGGITKAIRDAWNAYWGNPQMNFNRQAIYGFSPNSQYGSPASPHSGMSPMGNVGNIEGIPAGAYGPGPLDPMSAWSGPGWSPGVGQPAPGTGPYSGPITGTGYPGANTNHFGTPSFGFDSDNINEQNGGGW